MAKETNARDAFKIPQDAKDRLRKAKQQFAGANKSLEGLKEMGIDVSEIEGVLDTDEKLVDRLIKQFKIDE